MKRFLRSPAELAGRGIQALRIISERAGMGPRGHAPAGAPAAPALPFPRLSRAELASIYAARPAEAAVLLEQADAVVAGRFHLLGLRDIDFGTPVHWAFDPIRGRRAANVHWSRIPFLDESSVGDHKLIWELNRHQWMVTVAQAWCVTEEQRYLDALARLMEGWLDANPPRRGINWASSLELSYRAIAWTWTLHLAGAGLPEKLRDRVLASLELHGIQIARFPSTWFSPNTHLTGEALGLLYLGTAWPTFPAASRWQKMGWRILLEQLPRHIRDDGTYFEQSTWYQAYTADIYLHGIALARAAGVPVPSWVEDRVALAARVVAELTRPDGTLPLIGDDDGGRLLPLCPVRTRFGDTAALAAIVLGQPVLSSPEQVPAGVAWISGTALWQRMVAEPQREVAPVSRAFPDGGWYILRGPEGSLVVDAGPHGALSGGHSHADALSLEWTVKGRAVLVDPGTGSYVGPWRDRFRATSAHNTLSLADGTGSATPTGPFQWGRWPQTRVLHWSAGPGWAVLIAEHDGFLRLRPGLLHRRTVWFRERWGWLLVDRLLGEGAAAVIRFQLESGLHPDVAGQVVRITSPEASPELRISGDGAGAFGIVSSLVSHCHGEAGPAPAIVRSLTEAESGGGVASLLTDNPDASVSRDPDSPVPAWIWRSGNETARLELRDERVTILQSDGQTRVLQEEGG